MPPQQTVPHKTGRRVLLCEDEGVALFAFRKALVRAGYAVIGEESNGEKAVALAKQLHPDVIVMDVGLTGPLSGIEAARHILQERTLPIVVLSAYSDDAHRSAAFEAGVCGYLVKPIASEQLIPALEAALAYFESVHPPQPLPLVFPTGLAPFADCK